VTHSTRARILAGFAVAASVAAAAVFAVPLGSRANDERSGATPGPMLAMGRSVPEPQAPASSSASSHSEQLAAYWDQAKASLKQGAYREALQTLDVILTMTPNDPWASLYRSLCEARLQGPAGIAPVSRAELQELHERLRQEERQQRRAAAQHRAIEREIQKEQAKWDRDLEQLQREAEREQKRKLQAGRKEAVEKARHEAAVQQAQRQRAQQVAREQAVAKAVEVAPSVVPVTPEPQVELAPVVVPTREAPPSAAPSATPPPVEDTPAYLADRPVPPEGTMKIDARQMSVLPDRNLAIAEGDVEVVSGTTVLICNRLTLFTDTNDVYAEGDVRLQDESQVFRGELAHYNFDTRKGRFLQGTVSSPPWHEHGRSVEHIAEGVYQVTPGYVTSCELEPPHFKFYGQRAIVFSEDKLIRARNTALMVERVPFLYLPWLTVADRQAPFYFLPGKKKPWGEFALMGYRYELPELADGGSQKGSLKLDWRHHFRWGFGLDHRLESERWGKGLLKLYYNPHMNSTRQISDLPKGAKFDRYRVLWRHAWNPLPGTTVVTDFHKFSDEDFRKEFLFREEFVEDDVSESFISTVTSTPEFTLSNLVRKRTNRFQTASDALPQVTLDVRQQSIGNTNFFSETKVDFANFQSKTAHSDEDSDVIRGDWFQQLSYAVGWFRPIEVTPRAAVRQTYYTKDIMGAREGQHDVFSGQFSAGADASLKLFRLFPTTVDALGLNLNWLRHVLTPTVGYTYVHNPTVPNELVNFAAAESPTNELSFGVENKLQTKRPSGAGKLSSVDLGRFVISIPYTFHGSGNKRGGRLGDWSFDLEAYPWPWMRLESDWSYPSHFLKGSRDSKVTAWNVDLVIVGGPDTPTAHGSPSAATSRKAFEPGPGGALTSLLLPHGQWYLGLGHRFSHNDKTEDVAEFKWRLSDKWEIGAFHRYTWKEVAGTAKRFDNLREYQYTLRRDLHDWIGEFTYRVDREFGEEIWLTLTLKAYPELPIEIEDSYHQPKLGSQSSPFSPVAR